METRETAIAVPGKWESRNVLLDAISKNCPGFVMVRNRMKEIKGGGSVEVFISGPNPATRNALKIGSGGYFSESFIDEVSSHTLTAYLVGTVSGKDHYRSLVKAASAVVRSGGLAVILEASGLAYSANQWLEYTEGEDDQLIYDCCVNRLVEWESYSRGMRAYGLPDVVVPTSLTIEESFDLMDKINMLQLQSEAGFKTLEWFDFSGQKRAFRIVTEADRRVPEGHAFHNPYGVIKLIAAEEDLTGGRRVRK